MRLLQESDLPWLHYIFAKRYPPPRYSAACTERWFRSIVLNDALNFLAIRTDNAWLGAMATILPWIPGEPEVNVVSIAADDDAGWQVVKLLRASIEWARSRNAARWRLTSDTDYEIAPLALRVGAREIQRRFEIDLRGR